MSKVLLYFLRGTNKDWDLGYQDEYVHVPSNSQHVERSSSSAIDALSKRLCYALIMRSSPNFTELAADAVDGLVSISRRFGRFVVLELVLEIEVWLRNINS